MPRRITQSINELFLTVVADEFTQGSALKGVSTDRVAEGSFEWHKSLTSLPQQPERFENKETGDLCGEIEDVKTSTHCLI